MRTATSELHRRLDHHGVLSPLVGPSTTLEQYQRALLALHAITAPVEECIASYLEIHCLPFDYAARRRTPDLVDDLASYGLAPPGAAWDGPSITSDGALIGCLYVVEGATKGGRVIFRRMNRLLGVTDERGGRFFSGYGSRTEIFWRGFWGFATGHCPADQVPEAREAAAGLFHSYLTLLDRYQEI